MATLFDVITYDRKKYTELSDNKMVKDLIRDIASKLSAFEPEILEYPEAEIAIRPSGTIDFLEFPEGLLQRIQKQLLIALQNNACFINSANG